MPVVWRDIPVDLNGGLDTKSDEKYVIPGRLTVMENARHRKNGSLRKRNGRAVLSGAVFDDSTSPPDTKSLSAGYEIHARNQTPLAFAKTAYDNGERSLGVGHRQLVYSETAGKWFEAGEFRRCRVKVRNIRGIGKTASSNIAVPTVAGNSSLLVVPYLVIDEDTGNPIDAPVALYDRGNKTVLPYSLFTDADQDRIRAATYDGKTVVLSYDASSNDVVRRVFDLSSPGDSTPNNDANPTLFLTDLHPSSLLLDFCSVSGGTVLVHHRDIGGIRVSLLNADGTINTSNSIASVTPKNVLTVFPITNVAGTERIVVVYQDDSTEYLHCQLYDSALTKIGSVFTLSMTTISAVPTSITGASCNNAAALDATNSGTWKLFWTEGESVFCETFDFSGTQIGAVRYPKGVTLASKAFVHDGEAMVWVNYESTGQNAYFLVHHGAAESGAANVNTGWRYAARVFYTDAGPEVRYSNALSDVVNLGDGVFAFAALRKEVLKNENESVLSLQIIEVDLDPPPGPSVYFRGKTYGVSGFLWFHDGRRAQELGHWLGPADITSLTGSASGGSMSDGTYTYVAVLEWIDNSGDVHRSIASSSKEITLSAGGSSQKVTITVDDIRATNRGNWDSGDEEDEARIYIYRTGSDGVFHKTDAYPSISAFAATFVDTMSDTDLLEREVLYTEGGELANDAPPSCSVIAASSDRLFVGSDEHIGRVYPSKKAQPGVGLAFNLAQRVDALSEEITGIEVMDGNVVVFGEHRIARFAGDGPNNLGQGSFSSVFQVSSDLGNQPGSPTLLTSKGILFKSSKGIYLLSRGFETSYIGAEVEDYNDASVLSMDLDDYHHEARVLLDTGAVLVYDLVRGQWSTFTSYSFADACVAGGVQHFIASNGAVEKESSGFRDDTADIAMRVKTGWLSFGSLQGFKRVRRAILIGKLKSDHTLTVRVRYDYDDTVVQTITFDSSNIAAGDDRFEFRFRLAKQKCSAVMLEILDGSLSGTAEGYEISQVAFEVGLKKGMARLRAAQSPV